jgi:two-component system, LytTR family, sensor kinase
VYRRVAWLTARPPAGGPLPQLAGVLRLVAAHAAGATAFAVLHLALMTALRWPIYLLLTGRPYGPMAPMQALGYEGAKDIVTYAVVALLAWGAQLRQREQAQRLDLARSQAALTQLQLARLASQLQPHFLFNGLNTVAALVEENPKAAVTMIARLGDFLREALRVDAAAMTTLGQELALASDYLAIQALRFESALQVEVDVAPALHGLAVPRLLLQPLVENAVKHGMVLPQAPLGLLIQARLVGERLQLSVVNSGHDRRPQAPGLGLGLPLVRERLRLQYGERASLEAAPTPDGGFFVRLDLPAEPGP